MKKFLGFMLLLIYVDQIFASGTISMSGKDLPSGSLRIFRVATPLDGSFGPLRIQAADGSGKAYVLIIPRHVLKYQEMDAANFMNLVTSKNTNVEILCLDAKLINGDYTCQRLAVNATDHFPQ